MSKLNMDSKSYVAYRWKAGQGGNVIVEYDNLMNSSYIGEDGQKHKISKIRVTYSLDQANADHGMIIFSDLTDGFGYLNARGARATYVLYGDNGKLLDLSSGRAYLAVSSLNRDRDSKSQTGGWVESVQGQANTKVYALAGSSISLHGGNTLYADNPNSGVKSTWNKDLGGTDGWDNKGPYEYYGTGLIEATKNNFSLHFFTDGLLPDPTVTNNFGGTWVNVSTIIPATPEPKAEVHYHYDVFRFSVKVRTLPYISL